jgi:hypothetical protein
LHSGRISDWGKWGGDEATDPVQLSRGRMISVEFLIKGEMEYLYYSVPKKNWSLTMFKIVKYLVEIIKLV